MAFDPLELATIVGIIIVFFLWGPQKIPEIARMISQARKEFDNATREFQNVSASIQNGTNPLLASLTEQPPSSATPKPPLPGVRSAFPQGVVSTATPAAAKTGDELLIEAARRLGILTQGKTREQIQQEIITMAQSTPASSSSSSPPEKEDSAA
jgi:sec-independent protein translocase protein TatA